MKRSRATAARTCPVLAALVLFLFALCPASGHAGQRPKNVIVLIADGCGAEHYTLARWMKGAPLALDSILTGGLSTYIADSVVADSAPAASAFAAGVRTSDKLISVGPHEKTLSTVPAPPPELRWAPVATVLEGARLLGKATGIVSTSRVTHATPAAYIAHAPSRNDEEDIMEQAVHQGIDVVFGGGGQYLKPAASGGKRADGEDLAKVLKERGYALLENREQLLGFSGKKAYGMFAPSHMQPDCDRATFAPGEPSLEEMTRKAVETLAKNPKGFFLMVEGSEIDWADHANDPAQLVADMLAFDRAVAAALDFAKKRGDTLVLAFSDHNTGGFSIGNYKTSNTYSQMSVESLVEPLRRMKLSAAGVWKKLETEKTPERLQAVVKEFWGMEITPEDAARVLEVAAREKDDPSCGVGEVLSPKYTNLGWTTHGHTGGDVPFFAFGPGRPVGLLDGPGVGKVTARALGLDFAKLNRRLFVEAASAFPGGSVAVEKADPKNLVVKVEWKGRKADFPVNKNVALMGGKTVVLEGVVVYAPKTGKAYLPLQAVKLVSGAPATLPGVTP